MRIASAKIVGWAAVVFACAVHLSLPPMGAAQSSYSACTGSTYYGDKYVWQNSTTYCNYHDYIDVSNIGDSNDVCKAIKDALTDLSANGSPYEAGGVVDARGIPPSTSGALACSVNPFPSTGSKVANGLILLPAGTFLISNTWYLPPNTRLVGEGPNATIIKAASGFTSGTMIFMGDPGSSNTTGSSPLCGGDCNGIVIEHLQLYGNGTLNGIGNAYAQELSYVNDVYLNNIGGTGLTLYGNIAIGSQTGLGANNSGPYTNIQFSGASGSRCLSINATRNTRGVNGIHCTGSGTAAPILLDSSNNVLQNVVIDGFTGDGVAIGSNATSANVIANNVLISVSGSSNSNVVNIYSTRNPTDITLMGISGGTSTTINDQVTNSSVAATSISGGDAVSLYVLGEPLAGGSATAGYSRFVSALGVPNLYHGKVVPTTGGCGGTGEPVIGSLFTLTIASPGLAEGTNADTMWGCVGTAWVKLSTEN